MMVELRGRLLGPVTPRNPRVLSQRIEVEMCRAELEHQPDFIEVTVKTAVELVDGAPADLAVVGQHAVGSLSWRLRSP